MKRWIEWLAHAQYRKPLVMPVLVLLMASLLVGLWLQHSAAERSRSRIHAELEKLASDRESLLQRLAEADVNASVHRNAQLSLRHTVDQQTQTIAEINRQLDFYRLLMEGSDSRTGLELTSSLIYPLDGAENGYHFRFTFVQYAKKRRVLNAKLSIALQGLQAGMPKSYPLETLMDSAGGSEKLRFKYFQSIQGQIKLPDGFEPQQFVIDAQIKSKNAKPWQRIVKWQLEE